MDVAAGSDEPRDARPAIAQSENPSLERMPQVLDDPDVNGVRWDASEVLKSSASCGDRRPGRRTIVRFHLTGWGDDSNLPRPRH